LSDILKEPYGTLSSGEPGHQEKTLIRKGETMSSIVTFIGWHDSEKTTLAAGVLAELKNWVT